MSTADEAKGLAADCAATAKAFREGTARWESPQSMATLLDRCAAALTRHPEPAAGEAQALREAFVAGYMARSPNLPTSPSDGHAKAETYFARVAPPAASAPARGHPCPNVTVHRGPSFVCQKVGHAVGPDSCCAECGPAPVPAAGERELLINRIRIEAEDNP